MKKLLILGAGGHGRVVAEIAKAIGSYSLISFLDDSYVPDSNEVIIGKLSDVESFYDMYDDAFVALGNCDFRQHWMGKLYSLGYNLPVLIHPHACVSYSE